MSGNHAQWSERSVVQGAAGQRKHSFPRHLLAASTVRKMPAEARSTGKQIAASCSGQQLVIGACSQGESRKSLYSVPGCPHWPTGHWAHVMLCGRSNNSGHQGGEASTQTAVPEVNRPHRILRVTSLLSQAKSTAHEVELMLRVFSPLFLSAAGSHGASQASHCTSTAQHQAGMKPRKAARWLLESKMKAVFLSVFLLLFLFLNCFVSKVKTLFPQQHCSALFSE